jgi:hypothetical protein
LRRNEIVPVQRRGGLPRQPVGQHGHRCASARTVTLGAVAAQWRRGRRPR